MLNPLSLTDCGHSSTFKSLTLDGGDAVEAIPGCSATVFRDACDSLLEILLMSVVGEVGVGVGVAGAGGGVDGDVEADEC